MKNKNELTKKQQEIYNYLKLYISEHTFPPSVREICKAVNLKSTSSVHGYLQVLETKGYITKDTHNSRSIRINTPDSNTLSTEQEKAGTELVMVPVVGTVAAGVPILATEMIEDYFPIPADKLPNKQTFFLRVKGDSMVNAGIFDRDLILVEQKNTANNGDIVVALLDDSATVKTFYKEKDHIRLQPENDYMDPIIVKDNLTVLGKVIGAMRFF